MAHRIINGTIDKEMKMLKEQIRDANVNPSAARALRAIPSQARSEQSRENGRRGGRPAAWYRYDAGEDLGIVWVRGTRRPTVYDDRGTRLSVALPVDWRTRAEATTLIPATLAAIR